MKIRIKSNSIRYRLTRSAIKKLALTGYLDDKVSFGKQSLIYAIRLTDDKELSSTFVDHTITLLMPKGMINELINTNRVGFENDAGPLHILVEKDFACLDNVNEDQSDNYPNPLADKNYEEGD
ncbi:MAG TPA: hypothetical protein DCO83_09955 [Mucilaginibacter sp.]|jgi:hypothetical protein|nr:hypothetical protein [Mucilaginibacter sp.]